MAKVLIVSGGWEGHDPHGVADLLKGWLEEKGAHVELGREIDDFPRARDFDVVVPNWTMGEIPGEVADELVAAVGDGVGLAGVHGGMGDAFRNCTEYQFVVGGQFVAHPGPGDRQYQVMVESGWELTEGLEDFEVRSEKYYLHVDPAIQVLAWTEFEDFGGVRMPVAWTKKWGEGSVFYCSIGHDLAALSLPMIKELVTRGILWAGRKGEPLQGARLR
ncbi:hypothetical protein C0431_02350 [bacterium]|nr:hypothetical protein [bacterium]